MRRAAIVIVAVLGTLLTACSAGGGDGFSAQDSSHPQGGEVAPEEAGAGFPAEDGETGDEDAMVIRNKTIRLEVPSTSEAADSVRALTREHSGTVSAMQLATEDSWIYPEDGDGAALRGWVTVRIPTDEYEDFVAGVVGLGDVKYQSEATEDVTQQHVDMTARLENLRAQEARLREFFDAATKVEEMLQIESELARVRGEIESLDAQVKYLERQAARATVTIELTEPEQVVRPQGASWGFVEAITDGFRGAAALLTGVITAVIATAPLWILALVLFFPVRAAVRRRRDRQFGTPAPATATADPADLG